MIVVCSGAKIVLDLPAAMIRIDMSEYMEKHSVARLVGAPPGYVGYEEGGYLTEAVRRKPYSVILLDEVEKAHPDVFNILLQVLDDGRLTDSQGRTVDFRNTVIVMTSNLGSSMIQERIGKVSYEQLKEDIMQVLTEHFRPEFVNRVDDVVVFRPLGREQIHSITRIQTRYLDQRLAAHDMGIEFTEEALDLIGEAGFDPVYGARPLRRVIQNRVENPLAQEILRGSFAAGDTIQVDVQDGKFVFRKGAK
jgi:ATP-dependent Clp protease ATP-binding subunit ClpB